MKRFSRQVNEGFRVGCATISVNLISDGKVRLIIGTPKGVPIHRSESYRVLFQGHKGRRPRNGGRNLNLESSKFPDALAFGAIVRAAKEGLMIGDSVEIVINDVGSDDTKFGIKAPEDVEVTLLD